MHCWMGLHFHGRIDYNGVTVTFSLELLEWDLTFSAFWYLGHQKILLGRDLKMGRFVLN